MNITKRPLSNDFRLFIGNIGEGFMNICGGNLSVIG